MIVRSTIAILIILAMPWNAAAQQITIDDNNATISEEAAEFDTSYRPSPSISARLQREFLSRIRWSAGAETRDNLASAFAEQSPSEIWSELVAADGLTTNNVADALTAYWVLNWVAANGAYSVEVDSRPVQRQLRQAFADDPNFIRLSEQQRQEMAEGYILNFLVEHAALNAALQEQDIETLYALAMAAANRFRRQMNIDLFALVPGPDGFVARRTGD